MTPALFVYGTLAPGAPNQHMLATIDGHWRPASMRGRLHNASWATSSGYPAIEPDEHAEPVAGHVFFSAHLHRHWPKLDAFEGDQYQRVPASARLADGTDVNVFVYARRG